MSTNRIQTRTVLISSRIDELGSSRRAAFRAVHDEGWIPLLYEIEPDEWLAAQRRAFRREDRRIQEPTSKEVNERLTMNSLLNQADHFIGIYGTSLGDPSAGLNGLRPLEYEVVRFLTAHVLRKSGKRHDSMEDVFRKSATPEGFHAARENLRRVLAACKEPGPYREIFRDRMALFLKEPPGDVPASSLMYSTIYRLQRFASDKEVDVFRSRFATLESGAVVYQRPSSHLYLKIRLQIRRWKRNRRLQNIVRPEGDELLLQVKSEPEVGYVLHVVKSIFYEGYNVRTLCLRKKSNGDRVMYARVVPYLHAGNALVENLRNIYYCQVRPCEKIPEALQSHSRRGLAWRLEIIVADRPGMLARALAALALQDMQVIDMQIEDVERTKGPGHGPRNHISVIFKKSGQRRPSLSPRTEKDFSYPQDYAFALDVIAADLSSQPGFYSVVLNQIPAGAPPLKSSSE